MLIPSAQAVKTRSQLTWPAPKFLKKRIATLPEYPKGVHRTLHKSESDTVDYIRHTKWSLAINTGGNPLHLSAMAAGVELSALLQLIQEKANAAKLAI
jgi:hypothetical protein